MRADAQYPVKETKTKKKSGKGKAGKPVSRKSEKLGE